MACFTEKLYFENISTSTTALENVKIIEDKKNYLCSGDNMSIVGFFKCKDGILLMSDSKSTLNFESEKGRENIDKFFYNNCMAIGNFGRNKIGNIPVEEFVPSILKYGETAYSFINKLQIEIIKKSDEKKLYFIIYDYFFNDFKFVHFQNGNKNVQSIYDSYIIGGNEYYIGAISEIISKLNIDKVILKYEVSDIQNNEKATKTEKILDISREELKEILEEKLTTIINKLDELEINNPCGLPLKFHYFEYYL